MMSYSLDHNISMDSGKTTTLCWIMAKPRPGSPGYIYMVPSESRAHTMTIHLQRTDRRRYSVMIHLFCVFLLVNIDPVSEGVPHLDSHLEVVDFEIDYLSRCSYL